MNAIKTIEEMTRLGLDAGCEMFSVFISTHADGEVFGVCVIAEDANGHYGRWWKVNEDPIMGRFYSRLLWNHRDIYGEQIDNFSHLHEVFLAKKQKVGDRTVIVRTAYGDRPAC